MRHYFVVPVLVLALTGCTEEGTFAVEKSPTPEEESCNLETNSVSFSQHLLPIFNERCIECHQPGTFDDQRPYLTVENWLMMS